MNEISFLAKVIATEYIVAGCLVGVFIFLAIVTAFVCYIDERRRERRRNQ